MKLLRLSYQDLASGLSIDSCEFFPDLNLLVGISGAGKTSILKAISNLKRIANGESINGVKWDVELLTNDHVRYHWLGEFEVRKARSFIKIEGDKVNSNDGENKVSIISETLLKDQEVLIARNQEVKCVHCVARTQEQALTLRLDILTDPGQFCDARNVSESHMGARIM
ncbi:MAG: hypothetical protein ACKO8H_24810, partial [Microcystis panniformis]